MDRVLACQVKGGGSNPVSIILFFFVFVTFDVQVNYSFCIFVVGRLDQPNYIFFSFFFVSRVRVHH